MTVMKTRLQTHRTKATREFITGKSRFIRDFADWVLDNGCTHAITITPDLRPGLKVDPEIVFKPYMRRLCKAIAHDVRGVPLRKLGFPVAVEETVWMAGFVEHENSFGIPYPHFHGAVALKSGEDRLFRGVMANRWGKGPAVPALRPVFRKPGSSPDFDLTRFTDAKNWTGYALKQTSLKNATLWTHKELLETH